MVIAINVQGNVCSMGIPSFHVWRYSDRLKASADGFIQTRPLAEITNTPRRVFHDLTNRIQSKNSEWAPERNTSFKGTDLSEKTSESQHKIVPESPAVPSSKEDDSIEHCFGSSEPPEWKGEVDAIVYLNSLQGPESDFEEEPLSHVPLVNIPHLPEGFFDDIPDDFLEEVSDVEQDEPCIFVAP